MVVEFQRVKGNIPSILLQNIPILYKAILHCSAGFDNSPTVELKAAGIKALRVRFEFE